MSGNPKSAVGDRPGKELTISLQIEIAAPPSRVWSIVATPDGMRKWQGAVVFEPRLGGNVRFELGPTGNLPEDGEIAYVMTGRVVRFEPEGAIAYTWRQHEVGGESWPEETLITLVLEPHGAGTRVKVIHSGFEKLPGELAAAAHRDYGRGWEHHDDLARLKSLAEGGA